MRSVRVRSAVPVLVLALGLGLWLAAPASAQIVGPINVSDQSMGGSPGDSRHPHMAFDESGVLHVVWADETGNPTGVYQIRYARSFDGGHTFTPAVQLSFGAGGSLRPRVAAFHGVAYVVWMQDPDDGSEKEVYFAAVVDGALARGPVNLSNSPGSSREARIAVDGAGRIFVVWDESDSPDAPYRHIALARSFDAGASFVKSVIAPLVTPSSSTCPPGSVGNCLTVYPGVAVDRVNGNVYTTWHDRVGGPTGEYQIFFSRSLDAGNTFSAPMQISSAAIHAHCAAITVGPSGKILVAYEVRKAPGALHTHDSVFQQSTDFGASFGPPVDLSNSTVEDLSDYPYPVEAPDGTIFVGWEDSRFPGGDLSATFAISHDGGGSFSSPTPVAVTPGTSTEVITAFDRDGSAVMLWEDHEAGEDVAEVYLARIGGVAAPAPGGLQLAIRSTQAAYRAGETLSLGAVLSNAGPAVATDVYFGVLLPAAAGPALGCPGQDAIQFEANLFTSRAVTCLSRIPQNTPALAGGFVVPAGLPETTFPNLFAMFWDGGLTPGPYTIVVALTRAGALADGRLDAGDVLALALRTVLFTP